MKKRIIAALLAFVMMFAAGCAAGDTAGSGSQPAVGDEAYESQQIEITGAGVEKTISVSELRALEQHDLQASYKRTTGLYEEFEMAGPYLADVFSSLGLNIGDYAGIGVEGTDGYYCLVTADIIAQTPDLMLALTIDGQSVLPENEMPARLAVQGQFGPYWVRMVERITLYTEIPEKVITSVWVFDNLCEGIEPYYYEYYGSKDEAYDLKQVFSRFDNVKSDSFFTMKSSDGFEKNETINMIMSNSDYYIKTEGEDSPTNAASWLILGQNVQHIAWFSTNADAAVFPEEMEKYMDTRTISGCTGVQMSEVLFESGVKAVEGVVFDVLGTEGEKVTVSGEDLYDAILCINADGTYSVVWEEELGHENITDLMRVRVAKEQVLPSDEEQESADEETPGGETPEEPVDEPDAEDEPNPDAQQPESEQPTEKENVVLTVKGDGVSAQTGFTMDELRALGTKRVSYSTLNNWPTVGTDYGEGVAVKDVLKAAGLLDSAQTVKVIADDGFYAVFTRKQLLEDHMCYPNLASGSDAGAQTVPALLAWKYGDNAASAEEEGDLKLIVGQRSVTDVNTEAAVKYVTTIEVSTAGAGKWGEPTPTSPEGTVAEGTQIGFTCDFIDRVKIYYTTDGSAPTTTSTLYNPSVTRFQADLLFPVTVQGDTTIRILVTGWGKADASYDYEYKAG